MNPQIQYLIERGYSTEDMSQYWKARFNDQPAWFALKMMRQSYQSRANQRMDKITANSSFC